MTSLWYCQNCWWRYGMEALSVYYWSFLRWIHFYRWIPFPKTAMRSVIDFSIATLNKMFSKQWFAGDLKTPWHVTFNVISMLISMFPDLFSKITPRSVHQYAFNMAFLYPVHAYKHASLIDWKSKLFPQIWHNFDIINAQFGGFLHHCIGLLEVSDRR